MATTPSRCTRSLAAWAPLAGLASSSISMSWSGRPRTPPLALMVSQASSAPFRSDWPMVEAPPVSGLTRPSLMGPASGAAASSATSKAVVITEALLSG